MARRPISILKSGVLSFAVTQDGSHFAGSTEGLYRFADDGSNLGLEAHDAARADSIGPGYVGALLSAGEDGLWVGVGGSGLFLRDARTGRYRGFRHDAAVSDSLTGDYITALSPAKGGYLWVGTRSDGLNRCRIEPWSCERFDGRSASEPNLRHFHVTALRRDRDGGLWVATDGGGLHRAHVDAQGRVTRFERWGIDRGLLTDGIMGIEEDDDGSLWLSTRHGLSRLDPATGRVVNHVAQSGLPVSHFNTGASSADTGFVHFGSVEGLVSIPKGTPLRVRAPAPVRITGIERLAGGAGQLLAPATLLDGFEKQARRSARSRVRRARFRRDAARVRLSTATAGWLDCARPPPPDDVRRPGTRPLPFRSARPRRIRRSGARVRRSTSTWCRRSG